MGTAKQFGRTGAAALAALIVVATVDGAGAADLAAFAPMAAPAAEPVVEWGSGWYLRGDLAVSDDKRDPMMRLPGTVTGGGKSATNFGGDVGFGYQVSDYFRTDATLGTGRRLTQTLNATYDCTLIATGANGTCTERAATRFNRIPLLINGYADLGNYGGVRPYVGAGVGVTWLTEQWERSAVFNGATPFTYATFPAMYGVSPNSGKKTKTNFTYALMAGLGYDIRDGVTLDVGYRYLDMGSAKIPGAGTGVSGKQREHELRVGLRYRID